MKASITTRADIMHGWRLDGDKLSDAVCSGAATFHYVKTREDFDEIEGMFQNIDSFCPLDDAARIREQEKYRNANSWFHIFV